MISLLDTDHSSRKTDHPKAGVRSRIAAFRRDEEGSMIIMTLFIFMFMMVMAGLGIDTMRHEMERARLQATLDSAVLAGAKAPFGEDPEVIVKDYFAKADMTKYLNPFKEGDVSNTLNSSKVAATASMTMDTYLMKLSGVKSLSATAAATAETRIPKLEIALVLDVSNSMNDDDKIGELRKAAKEFVTTILASGDPGAISLSIVPFSTSVTPTDGIFEALLVDEKHNYSNCLTFDDNDYNDTALVTKTDATTAAENNITLTPLTQDIYSSYYGSFDNLNQEWRSCYTEDAYRIMPFSTSKDALHTKIDGLLADGNTTGDLGIKWGAALLDPSFRDVTSALIASNDLPASMAQTPVDYTESDTMKVIVMMGDGENSRTFFFADDSDYKGVESDLFHVEYQEEELDYGYVTWNVNRRYYGAGYESYCGYSWFVCVYEPAGEIQSAYFLRDPEWTHWDGLQTTAATAVASVAEAGPPCASLIENYFNGIAKNNTGAWENHECGAAVDPVLDSMLDDWHYYDLDNGQWLDGTEFVELRQNMSGFLERDQLSWEEAWGMIPPRAYGNITGIWDPFDEYEDNKATGATKNTRMDNVCTVAKNNGVVIYTIGYMVPSDGTAEQSLKKCATGYDPVENASSYYYDVDDVDISKAFSSIAGNVQSLRLTQ